MKTSVARVHETLRGSVDYKKLSVGSFLFLQKAFEQLQKSPTTEMIIRLGRLTPGYFRLLQRQMSGEVRVQPHSSLMEPIAMTMATVGLGVSLYSCRQMTMKCTTDH